MERQEITRLGGMRGGIVPKDSGFNYIISSSLLDDYGY